MGEGSMGHRNLVETVAHYGGVTAVARCEAGEGNIVRHGFFKSKTGKAKTIPVYELRRDVLLQYRHALPRNPVLPRCV